MEKNEKLKNIQLGMLKEFIRICNKNSLTYFIGGGTALGAVRHKGFIPWDDDIDVILPREDYEKFLKVAQVNLPENMFLQTFETDKNYPNIFAKIRRIDTTFIETSCANIKMNHGVYIDIFPMDGYPDSNIEAFFLEIKIRLLKIRIAEVFSGQEENDNFIKKFIKKIIRKNPSDYRVAVKKLDALCKKYDYNTSCRIVNFGGAWGGKEIIPKAYLGNGIEGEFENIKVILPEKVDEFLTNFYGEYMTPPPIEKQVTHHYCKKIDLEKSYIHYM